MEVTSLNINLFLCLVYTLFIIILIFLTKESLLTKLIFIIGGVGVVSGGALVMASMKGLTYENYIDALMLTSIRCMTCWFLIPTASLCFIITFHNYEFSLNKRERKFIDNLQSQGCPRYVYIWGLQGMCLLIGLMLIWAEMDGKGELISCLCFTILSFAIPLAEFYAFQSITLKQALTIFAVLFLAAAFLIAKCITNKFEVLNIFIYFETHYLLIAYFTRVYNDIPPKYNNEMVQTTVLMILSCFVTNLELGKRNFTFEKLLTLW